MVNLVNRQIIFIPSEYRLHACALPLKWATIIIRKSGLNRWVHYTRSTPCPLLCINLSAIPSHIFHIRHVLDWTLGSRPFSMFITPQLRTNFTDHWIMSAPNHKMGRSDSGFGERVEKMCLQTFKVFDCFVRFPQGNKKLQYNSWIGISMIMMVMLIVEQKWTSGKTFITLMSIVYEKPSIQSMNRHL